MAMTETLVIHMKSGQVRTLVNVEHIELDDNVFSAYNHDGYLVARVPVLTIDHIEVKSR